MCKAEISVIPCSAEIDLNGITPVGNLMEINRTSETQKLRGNLTEILMEMLNRNGTRNNCKNSVINGITRNNPEITKRNGNFGIAEQFWYIWYLSEQSDCRNMEPDTEISRISGHPFLRKLRGFSGSTVTNALP